SHAGKRFLGGRAGAPGLPPTQSRRLHLPLRAAQLDAAGSHRLKGDPLIAASVSAHTMKKSAYLAFALLGVIWGSNFIFMKWAVKEISPAQIVLLRVVFGFLPIFVFALAKRALRWEHIRYLHHFV